jgi:uncharacterized protein YceH (UPF0502 family)
MESSATRDSSQAASDDTGAGEETTQLTSKKFKLKPDLHDQLEEQAEEHYAGNASALIRAALKDHFTTLEGENEYEVQKLQAKIADLEDQVAELTNSIEERNSNQRLPQLQQLQSPPQSDTGVSEQSSPTSNSELLDEVYRALANADSSRLTLDELQNQTDSNLVELQETIDRLIDKDFIKPVTDAENRTFEINPTTNE